MTAPWPAPGEARARLAAVASWDVPLLRRAVALLSDAAERLQPWRARLEGVGRSLESGEAWSGPAARSAVTAVHELASVTWAVDTAVARSQSAYERLVREADTAQGLAAAFLAVAGSVDPTTAGGLVAGSPVEPQALAAAESALDHARAASAAAEETGAALAGLGVDDAFAPARFVDLVAGLPLVGPVVPPPLPQARSVDEAATWWAALSPPARRAAIAWAPSAAGRLDGVPAWARDRANRRLLAAALADPHLPADQARTAREVDRRLRDEAAAGQAVQLQLLDLPGGRVVLGLGDLDSADVVAVLVPGASTTPADDLGHLVTDARAVGVAARDAAPQLSVATTIWLGYRAPPTVPAAATRLPAWRGGDALAAALAGIAAARVATRGDPGRLTVVAHSYGTVVLDEAADAPGRLAADAVVLLGSPGMEDDAASLEAPEVFDSGPPGDPVARLGWFGRPPSADGYGSVGLPGDDGMGHSDYYDPAFPTLAAIGEVVAGVRTVD